jgi:hypothetical protein
LTDGQGVVDGELDDAVSVLSHQGIRGHGFGVVKADVVWRAVIDIVSVVSIVGSIGIPVTVCVGIVGRSSIFGKRDGDGRFEAGGVGLQKKVAWLEIVVRGFCNPPERASSPGLRIF